MSRGFLSLLAGLWLALIQPATAEPLRVFAAASLGTALDRIGAEFTAATGREVTVSAAGSSALARQIAAGAPADVFISANVAWMDDLKARDLLAPGSRFDLAGNALVLIGARPGDPVAAEGIAQRIGAGRLALALVEAVPAGIYAKSALTTLGQWDGLAPQVLQADNVRAALALVALGAAPYGIVYATDAVAEPRVHVLHRFDPALHAPITYPAAALATAPDPDGAAAFLSYLRSAPARTILAAQGFTDPPR